MLELGRARQTTGQKSRVWTEEKNNRFMAKLDEDGSGTIDFEVLAHHTAVLERDRMCIAAGHSRCAARCCNERVLTATLR